MSITDEIAKEYINKNKLNTTSINTKNEICNKLMELINDLESEDIEMDKIKINISTISKSGVKSKIKYIGKNRKYIKWRF